MSDNIELNPCPHKIRTVKLEQHYIYTYIKTTSIEYMPESLQIFVESNTKNSWMDYLMKHHVSMQGTRCDGCRRIYI